MQETSSALIDQLVYIDNFMMNSETPNLDVDGQLSLDLAAFADDSFIFADEEKPDRHHSDLEDDQHQNGANQANVLGQSHQNEMPFDFHTPNGSSSRNLENSWFHEDAPTDLNHDVALDQGTNTDSNQLHFMLNNKIMARKKERYGNGTRHTLASQQTNFENGDIESVKHKEESEQEQKSNDLSTLPKFPVPPGANNSLKKAGLSQNQIDLLSALVAQHQTTITGKDAEEARPEAVAFPPTLASNGPQPEAVRRSSRISDTSRVGETSGFPDLHDHPTSVLQQNVTRSVVESPVSINGSDYSSGSVSASMSTSADLGATSESQMSLADLDKRRRNTAASARFRIKKKLKEKEIEDKISSLNDKIKNFQLRIDELTLENRLLKSLIIEKGERESDEELKLLKDRAKYNGK